uniref:7TM diverse intracellular signaling domain-containing protein n=1 Tax=Fulvivirga sp. TaxID=1931237 RepID=UPI00404A233A
MNIRNVVLVLCVMAPWLALAKQNSDSVNFNLNLNSTIKYLKSEGRKLTFQEALDKLENGQFNSNALLLPLNFGYDSSDFWFYTEYLDQNNALKVLELPYPYHQYLNLYINKSGNWQKIETGTMLPFDSRGTLKPLDYAWPIATQNGDSVKVMINIRSKAPVIVGLNLRSQTSYLNNVENVNLAYGLFFGALMIMLLYNLFLFVIIRDVTYLYYVLLVLANTAVFATVTGYAFKYIHPDAPEINLYIKEFLIAFLTIPTSLFAISFLELKKNSTWAYNVLLVMLCIGAFISVSTLFGVTYGFSSLIISFQAPLLLVIGVVERIKGNKIANFYIIAWSGYLVGGLAMTLRNRGVLPATFLTDHGAEFGTALDLFLLALALAYKYKKIRNEKSELQRENIRLVEQQNEILEERVRQRTELINSTLEMVKHQHEDLMSRSSEMNSSIDYALKIQQSMFPDKEKLIKSFKDVMLFNQPKETVSGDFFFFERINNKLFVAVVDCTGHGVPGALMSMAGYNLFYDAINVEKLDNPSAILEYVENHLHLRLNQKEKIVKDGMEAAICMIDTKTKQVHFCGAQRPLLVVRPESDPELIKGSKRSIGGYFQNLEEGFYKHTIDYNDNTCLYLFSDGFQDQFGGRYDKKYLSKNMVQKLVTLSGLKGAYQEMKLAEEFNSWKGEKEQVDDVLILGLKL